MWRNSDEKISIDVDEIVVSDMLRGVLIEIERRCDVWVVLIMG